MKRLTVALFAVLVMTPVVYGAGILEPIIELGFNEGAGNVTANQGSAGGTLTLSTPVPMWSTNVPPGGGAGSLDFGTTIGNYSIESPANYAALTGLTKFTVTGWANCRDSAEGPGGNRLVTWINHGGEGVDVVYKSDGSVQVGINQWPDNVPARSNGGKITTNAAAPADNWRFFAVTYDSTLANGHVKFYFGSVNTPAQFDVARDYARGPVGTNINRLCIGHFNVATRPGAQDRMFRGLIDDVKVFGDALSAEEVSEIWANIKSVEGPVPANGASGVGIDVNMELRQGLEWAFGAGTNVTHIDLYFGKESDPNLSAKPANKKLSKATATTTYNPGELDWYTQYYWRVDVYEPNTLPGGSGHVVTAGPVWTFKTAGQDPQIGPVSPVQRAVDEGASAVFTATGAVQVDNYQWWRKAEPADIQLANGAKYSGVTTETLTINGVVLADEGQYYCVVTNQLSQIVASNYDTAGNLMTRRLIIHYPLDTVVDSVTPDVVGGFDMTLKTFPTYTNPPSLVGGVPQLGGNGLFFDNFDSTNLNRWGQYATAGVVNLEDMGDGFTIALWVNQGNRSGYHAYLSRRVTYSATDMMWQMEFQAGQGVGFMRSGATNPARLMIPFDEWQYVVATVDKKTNTQRFYLNGELKRTQTNWTFGTGAHAELKMGCNQVNQTATPPNLQDALYGILDDVRIYNYARTHRQIALDYLNVVGGDGWICDADGPALPRDLNNDCRVDLLDLAIFAQDWLKSNRVYAEE
ncbi:MAG: hypothetical protein IH624_08750 [Phycisphaerae bacterium]|nr:hypothetical protein [Phycisphaerae bacterium]